MPGLPRWCPLLSGLVLLLAVPDLRAAGPPADREQAQALVRQLGDPSFARRSQAYRQLREMGKAALPALEAGAEDADPEIRDRCRKLLPLARRTEADLRLEAFLA